MRRDAEHFDVKSQPEQSTIAAFSELRAAIFAMTRTPELCQFCRALLTLLDAGNIAEIASPDEPSKYVVTGITSVDEVAHLLASVEDPVYAYCLELCVLGLLSMRPHNTELSFCADEPEGWIAQCRREIAEIERQLHAGHPDVEGLCLALADWSRELRLMEATGTEGRPVTPNFLQPFG